MTSNSPASEREQRAVRVPQREPEPGVPQLRDELLEPEPARQERQVAEITAPLCSNRLDAHSHSSPFHASREWNAHKSGRPCSSQAVSSASRIQDRVGKAPASAAIAGRRFVKSWPLRV